MTSPENNEEDLSIELPSEAPDALIWLPINHSQLIAFDLRQTPTAYAISIASCTHPMDLAAVREFVSWSLDQGVLEAANQAAYGFKSICDTERLEGIIKSLSDNDAPITDTTIVGHVGLMRNARGSMPMEVIKKLLAIKEATLDSTGFETHFAELLEEEELHIQSLLHRDGLITKTIYQAPQE